MAAAQRKRQQTNAFVSFLREWWFELFMLATILACAFSLAALVDWHVDDPSLFRAGPGRVENACGPAGATVATALFGLLGWGAWAIGVPAILAGVMLAGRPVFHFGRWFGTTSLFLVTLAGLELALSTPELVASGRSPGGLVGQSLGGGLSATFGTAGAWLVLGSLTILLITALFEIRWGVLAGHVVDFVERHWPTVKEHGLAAGVRGAQGTWWVTRTAASLFASVAALLGRWTVVGARHGARIATGGAKVAGRGAAAAGRGAFGSVGRVGDGFRRMGQSLTRTDHTDAGPASEGIDEDIGSDLPDPSSSAGVVDAQVEWEETSADSQVLELFPALAPRKTKSDPGDAPSRGLPVSAGPTPRITIPAAAASPDDLDEDDLLPDDDEDPEDPPSFRPEVKVPAGSVVVHRNELLGHRVRDDGGSVVKKKQDFQLPTLSMLDEVPEQKAQYDEVEMRRMASLVEEKLLSFKIGGHVVAVRPGPVVTIFEFLPDPGVKVSRIAALSDDLAMAMKAVSVRIVAPVPGKGVVGIEIPSLKRLTIYLRELLASPEFRNGHQQLPIALGQDVEGRPVVADLASMPHLLVGGTTGSGKSVGVNGMLMSLLYTRTPEDLRMLLVDPKKLEFEMYDGIPHLLYPVVTEPKEAAAALAWACREMDDRYEVLARWGVRNIVGFNAKVEKELKDWTAEKARKYAPKGWTEIDGPLSPPAKLPYIVIVIDELADLMMVAGKDVEESICRIAQKARACGIHLICATQRPSVDVVTGLIKANLPTRIAYQLRTRTDSRTILDSMGAEALLGRGDLLYLPPGVGNLARVHGAFCSDEEVSRVTEHVRSQGQPEYIEEVVQNVTGDDEEEVERDAMFDQAVQICIQQGKASTSLVQRHLKIGYNRAANLIEQMERAGIVGPADGARPREVLVSSVS